MITSYKIKDTNTKVELVDYVRQYLKEHKDAEILIGCDSQNKKRITRYAVCVGLYRPGKGAHVISNVFDTPRERETVVRLINEVWHSIDAAELLIAEGLPRASFIDIDVNPNPKYKSNAAFKQAVGSAEGMGYNVRHKGNYPQMSYAADSEVK